MSDHSMMRLGKKPVRRDRRTLRLARYLIPGQLPEPKPSVDWLSQVSDYGMDGNDVWGDCAIAAIAHMVQWWTSNIGAPQTPSLDDVLTVYKILSPDDSGLVLLDVLNYWRHNPICGVTLGAYASVNAYDTNEFNVALELFGGLYSGAELPLSAQTENVWTSTEGLPGEWGGHAIPWGAYNSTDYTCVTWGTLKQATQPWVKRYVDECYVLLTEDWLTQDKTPEGIDRDTLISDLKLITSN